MMSREIAERYASQWIAAWNRRDLDAVLRTFSPDVVFTSPRAVAVLGSESVRGTAALRAYWERSLAAVRSLHFTLDHVAWDAATRELAIVYTSQVDGETKRVAEHLRFGPDLTVVAGEVFHGVRRG